MWAHDSAAGEKVAQRGQVVGTFAQRIEERHRAAIAGLSGHPKLSRGRVMGTIAAIEVTDAQGYTAAVGQTLKRFFLERGLLLRPLGPVIYLLPPYCVTDGQLDRAYAAIREAADTLL